MFCSGPSHESKEDFDTGLDELDSGLDSRSYEGVGLAAVHAPEPAVNPLAIARHMTERRIRYGFATHVYYDYKRLLVASLVLPFQPTLYELCHTSVVQCIGFSKIQLALDAEWTLLEKLGYTCPIIDGWSSKEVLEAWDTHDQNPGGMDAVKDFFTAGLLPLDRVGDSIRSATYEKATLNGFYKTVSWPLLMDRLLYKEGKCDRFTTWPTESYSVTGSLFPYQQSMTFGGVGSGDFSTILQPFTHPLQPPRDLDASVVLAYHHVYYSPQMLQDAPKGDTFSKLVFESTHQLTSGVDPCFSHHIFSGIERCYMLRLYCYTLDSDAMPCLQSLALELGDESNKRLSFDMKKAFQPSWPDVMDVESEGLYYFFIDGMDGIDGMNGMGDFPTINIPQHSILHVELDADCQVCMDMEFVNIKS